MAGCFGGHPRSAGGPEPAKDIPATTPTRGTATTSAHPAALALQAGRLAVSFSGGGFLLPYHIGVVEVLLQLGVIRQRPSPAPAAATGPATADTAAAEAAAPASPQAAATGVAAGPGGEAKPLALSGVTTCPPNPRCDENTASSQLQPAEPPQLPPPTRPGPQPANTDANTNTGAGTSTSSSSYTPVAGSSAGSLVAASLACGLNPAQMLSTFLDSVRDCRTGGSFRRLDQVLLRQLEASLPPNAHELCTDLVTVGLTRLLPWPHIKRVSRFSSRRDLIAALLASCHIPRYFNGELSTSYRGKTSVDGGVTSLMPKSAAEHDFLLKVCCFPRRHVVRLPVFNRRKALRNLDLGISPDAFGPWPHRLTVMLEHALHPSDDDFLVLLLQAGRGDAMRWAVAAGLAPPPLCRWLEHWAAGLQQQQHAGPSHVLAEAAVAAAAADRAAGTTTAEADRADGMAAMAGALDFDICGCGLYLMPIPPELLGPPADTAKPAERPAGETPSCPQLRQPTAPAEGAAVAAATGAAAACGATAAAAGSGPTGPALQLVGPTAIAEGLVSRTASSATAPFHQQQQAQAPQCHHQHAPGVAREVAGMPTAAASREPQRLGRRAGRWHGACGFGIISSQLHQAKAKAKPKRLPYETAARLFVVGGKLLP
ncbi:hypothetical protein HXX76_010875 [Chlamydomonas incerta]|uniref:Patatin n=1 Tax=Chlamydomonas incerta TaxID=51695 RepID=A0A835SQT7_CHLIN|nr:hypothetical protein HXX76_010875 [Chlamydomonas incerta]|eukprot:KAG2429647.1 hypothetical protein HXX76_010875 [Chlamydomonas incerta]